MHQLQGDFEKQQGIYYEFDMESFPLGEGGMGRVFQGYRVVESNGARTPVAIKAVYDGMPDSVIERGRREASIQIDNDNLIRMYGFVETEVKDEKRGLRKTCYYIIMELLVGITLDDWLKGKVLNKQGVQIFYASQLFTMYLQNKNEVVVRIIKCILSGIMALHDNGFIHRDIDPTNVMITNEGKIKLIDFGICKQITTLNNPDQSLTVFGSFVGKVSYAAPELIKGDVSFQNETTDIYAVGILLYQLYTGQLPFSGTSQELKRAHLSQKICVRNISHPGIRKIIVKATNKKQELRYASAAEFRVALEHLNLSESITPLHIRYWGWKRAGICFGILILLGGILGLVLNWEHQPDPEHRDLVVSTSTIDEHEKEVRELQPVDETQNPDVPIERKQIIYEEDIESSQYPSITQEQIETTLDVSDSELNYPEEGGVKLIKIQTNNLDWKVRGDISWCNIRKGSDYCQITVNSNNSYNKRKNKIVISAGNIKKVVLVNQEPAKAEILSSSSPDLAVAESSKVSDTVQQVKVEQDMPSSKLSTQPVINRILLNGGAVDEREFDIKTNKRSENMIILRGEGRSATRVAVGQTLELSFPLDNIRAGISFCRTSIDGGKAMFSYSSTNIKGISFSKKIDEEQHICHLSFSFPSKGEYAVYVQGRKSYAFIGVD